MHKIIHYYKSFILHILHLYIFILNHTSEKCNLSNFYHGMFVGTRWDGLSEYFRNSRSLGLFTHIDSEFTQNLNQKISNEQQLCW